MTGQDAVREFATAKGAVFLLWPPTEEQRIRNQLTEGSSATLAAGLAELFGRWPSRG